MYSTGNRVNNIVIPLYGDRRSPKLPQWSFCSDKISNYCAITSNSEKAMAPHSSILAWKIPWTEESGRLQPMRSLRVGHD